MFLRRYIVILMQSLAETGQALEPKTEDTVITNLSRYGYMSLRRLSGCCGEPISRRSRNNRGSKKRMVSDELQAVLKRLETEDLIEIEHLKNTDLYSATTTLNQTNPLDTTIVWDKAAKKRHSENLFKPASNKNNECKITYIQPQKVEPVDDTPRFKKLPGGVESRIPMHKIAGIQEAKQASPPPPRVFGVKKKKLQKTIVNNLDTAIASIERIEKSLEKKEKSMAADVLTIDSPKPEEVQLKVAGDSKQSPRLDIPDEIKKAVSEAVATYLNQGEFDKASSVIEWMKQFPG